MIGKTSLKILAVSKNKARSLLLNEMFDVVVLDTPLEDGYGIEEAIDISEQWTVGILHKKLIRMEKKTSSLENKMDEMKIIDRAKWILVDREKMSESEAHRYIGKKAMDECARRVDVARDIIGGKLPQRH